MLLLILFVFWLPLAGLVYLVLRNLPLSPASFSNTFNLITLPLLYIEFILLVRWWGRYVYQQPRILARYGLEFSRRSGRELLTGLAIGGSSLVALFLVQALLGWLVWQPTTVPILQLVGEAIAISLGIGFAEELLFRGWLLDELQRDYRRPIALGANALIFAAVHGFRSQFPALVVLGLILVWAKWGSRDRGQEPLTLLTIGHPDKTGPNGRLALPMGLHAGLVGGYYVINVGHLVTYTNQVPTWVTGIDRNPLAGVMGLLFLGVLALVFQHHARSH